MSKRPSSGSEGQATQGPGSPGDACAAPDHSLPGGAKDTTANVVSWEEARLRQALPRVIGRCMSYSAATCFDEALVEAVRSFYGIEVDVATAETDILEDDFERVRFFPWFLWDFTPKAKSIETADLRAVGERFLDEGELSDVERDIVRALVCSTVAFVEVVSTHPEVGALVLRDVCFGDLHLVRDAGLSAELEAGQVSLLRLVHLPEVPLAHDLPVGTTGDEPPRTFAMLDAIYAVLPPEALPMVEAELVRLCAPLRGPDGLPPSTHLRRDTMRLMKRVAPELLDFAEHVLHKLTEPPTLVNADAEPIVLCRTFVGDAPISEAVLVATGFVREEGRWVLREDARTVGWLRPHGGGWAIEGSSRERFGRLREMLTRLGARLPGLHSEEELARAVAQWLALGECEAWLSDPEVDRAFRGQLGDSLSAWPDQPHPALGRRTPREVKGEPGGDAVVQRLLQRVRKVAGDAAGAQLSALLA